MSEAVHAFRCKSCGKLHPAEHAGENLLPHACVVCGAGVMFHPRTGIKMFDANNWEVLHEATDDRLEELGVQRQHVVQHAPAKITEPVVGRNVSVNTSETLQKK